MDDSHEFDYAVFDCDGVILDSNHIKTNAFRYAVENYPKHLVDTLVRYHQENGGISRYEKLRYFFEELSGDFSESKIQSSLRRFGEFCRKELLRADFVTGAEQYISTLASDNFPLFVVSGSDQAELREVLKQKGIADCFLEILGSPTSKRQNLATILSDYAPTGEGMFFGDARLDYEIAKEAHLQFTFVWGTSDWSEGLSYCKSKSIRCIKNFDLQSRNMDD